MTAGSEITARSCTSSQYDPYSKDIGTHNWNVDEISHEQTKIVEMCNGYAEGQAKFHYDFLSQNYEGIYNYLGYPDPQKVAEACAK